MKKGIALLITIGFIVILTSIITYMFSITEKVFDVASKVDTKNQKAILFSDVKSLLDRYAQDVKNSEDLDTFLLGTPPFFDEKSDLSLQIELKPLSNKININSILIKNKVDENIQNFIQNISATYNILDVSFFISLILDTIDIDDISRQALSEISRENVKFSNSRIINKDHFDIILNYYANTIRDNNILKVPWDELIYFGKTQKSILDCDRMGRELVYILGLNIEDFGGCSDLVSEENKKIADNYAMKIFSKESSYFMLVEAIYQLNSTDNKISFIYDMKTKKVEFVKNRF